MGGGSSTRRVSFESDENDNVTVVKGIRLSENVINRMREASGTQQTPSTPTPPPPLLPVPPPFNPIVSPPPQPAPEPVGSSAPPPVEPATLIKPPPTGPVASPLKVDEADLRRRIAEEVQRGLEKERSRRQQELHQWLEKERSPLQAQAREDKGSRVLASETAAGVDGIHYAALRERITLENEKVRTQSKQLEERQQALRKQEAFYREQVAKLEERSVQFYKVTSENYHKAADEVNAKFKRYEVSPVCADLQGQVVQCYRENMGRTLLCSSVASLYLQCVNSAKQKKLSTGG